MGQGSASYLIPTVSLSYVIVTRASRSKSYIARFSVPPASRSMTHTTRDETYVFDLRPRSCYTAYRKVTNLLIEDLVLPKGKLPLSNR